MRVKFLRKNFLDLDYEAATVTVTDAVADNDGQEFTDFLRNRNNTSGWSTSGSTDAALTQLDIDLGGLRDIDFIALVAHNIGAYTIKYQNPNTLLYVDFASAIAVTGNVLTTTHHTFTKVEARNIRLIISGTMTVDEDKFIAQILIAETFGDLEAQPVINPTIDKNRKATRYLSNKAFISKSISAFEVRLQQNGIISDADLTLVESLYDSFEGFLVWLCGGTQDQFRNERQGWRLEDFYLMNVANEYNPKYDDGFYKHGMSINLQLIEVN